MLDLQPKDTTIIVKPKPEVMATPANAKVLVNGVNVNLMLIQLMVIIISN